MRLQPKDSSWCGPAALRNALYAMGRSVSMAHIAKLAHTSREGTGERQIIRVIKALGYVAEEFSSDNDRHAKQWLVSHATLGVPLILCVDNWDHWVTVAGNFGRRVWLYDSENSPQNLKENGSWCLNPRTVLSRWKAARRVADGLPRYYGVAVFRRRDS
jgi:ABC-type bacteriocin/lantibiotic exporter with double-glycine peptidase domain